MIKTEDVDQVRILRIEHGKANAIDIEFFGALDEVLDAAEAASCEALVVTGTGSIFSAGVDLYRMVEAGPEYLDGFLPRLTTGLRRVFTFPKPVVAAINGHAIAGGCILACACDYRVMARGTGGIGVPELHVGVPFPNTPLEIVRFVVSGHNFQEVIYGGRAFRDEEAVERGLVDALVEPATLIEEAVKIGHDLAALGAEAFAISKSQIRRPTLDRIDHHDTELEAAIERIWKAPATHERIRDYLKKTLGR